MVLLPALGGASMTLLPVWSVLGRAYALLFIHEV